jgi:transcriptional regulator with XRE-family HTH domain
MKRADDKKDFGLVIGMLCLITGMSQTELSQESGVDKGLISDYVLGRKSPLLRTRERLAEAFNVRDAFLAELIPVCRGIRLAFEAAARGGRDGRQPEAGSSPRLEEKVAGAVLEAMAPFLLELAQLDDGPAPRAEDRSWAEARWADLEPLPAEEQASIVRTLRGDERSWALAVRICEASVDAASHDTAEALRLARLGVHLAEEAPGPEAWRLLLLGYCEPFVANALRVGGHLAAAGETFARADPLWQRGEGGDPAGLLDGTRRLDLKASLYRQNGRLAEALRLLDQALAGGPPEAVARLLIKKATTHTRAGDYKLALRVLAQAKPRIDSEREARLPFLHLFTLTLNACHLERYQAAERLLPRVEALAVDLRTELDGVRTSWLRGRTLAGLGRREEALAGLAEVRRYFLGKKMAFDFALVSLELATLHLEQGRARLVKEIAEEMVWIFKGEKVHKEALAALALFRHAARAEKARAEWTRRMVKYLYRAQHNPGLRFEV